MGRRSISELYQLQALPLSLKIRMTERRIRDWVNEFGESGVYVSFSGGKDSTVLLNIARGLYPGLKAMYVDTGLEYAEIRSFVNTFDNVDWVIPKKHFKQVCEEYGFPIISKEVSECVYGSRKYLKSIEQSKTVLTDSAVCQRHGRHPGHRQEIQQKEQSLSGSEDGDYP